jgi:hypothetical protein
MVNLMKIRRVNITIEYQIKCRAISLNQKIMDSSISNKDADYIVCVALVTSNPKILCVQQNLMENNEIHIE